MKAEEHTFNIDVEVMKIRASGRKKWWVSIPEPLRIPLTITVRYRPNGHILEYEVVGPGGSHSSQCGFDPPPTYDEAALCRQVNSMRCVYERSAFMHRLYPAAKYMTEAQQEAILEWVEETYGLLSPEEHPEPEKHNHWVDIPPSRLNQEALDRDNIKHEYE